MSQHTTTKRPALTIERSACARQPDGSLSPPQALSDYRACQAWVLLGDPGAGKTETFKALAAQEGGECLKVSDFLELSRPAGYRSPLFIDGLDEATALDRQSPRAHPRKTEYAGCTGAACHARLSHLLPRSRLARQL